jgi:Protein of unknown function (DUF1622)
MESCVGSFIRPRYRIFPPEFNALQKRRRPPPSGRRSTAPTVVVDPTFDNVIVLGLIVLIRTFLSVSLQLELEGRWPWQHDRPKVNRQG